VLYDFDTKIIPNILVPIISEIWFKIRFLQWSPFLKIIIRKITSFDGKYPMMRSEEFLHYSLKGYNDIKR